MPNSLANSLNPYLRQHADNPVDWVSWSEDAFAQARRRDVPVLVSIGYSTCHWCHVMAHECFEDADTAAWMNQRLVCIKVDREEHPEVDEIYMDAVQAMEGHGGWPLNAFVDHDGRPFYACTYVPAEGWRRLVGEMHRLWREDRGRIAQVAEQITGHLRGADQPGGALTSEVWDRLDAVLRRTFDRAHPGWAYNAQRAPKFPASQLIPLLVASGRPAWREQAAATLEAMQDAGLHDRVGGGFHRYSVDAAWRVPHFEKMLYDNAQLIGAYARAGAALRRNDFLRTAVNAADYLLRDLAVRSPTGSLLGLATAEDADDPGGEGSFYAWSPDQLAAVLGADLGARLAADWDLRPGAPHLGHSGHAEPVASHIPHPRGGRALADPGGAIPRRAMWEAHYPALRTARDARPRPGRDDKLLTDQNALALEALAALARHVAEPRFAAACHDLVAVLTARHLPDGLVRLPANGARPARAAFITDYGHLVSALTATFDLIGDPLLIDRAAAIANEAVDRLRADDGGFYTTPAGRRDLVRRSREHTDNAWPSGQNALAVGLLRLWNCTGVARWRALAEGIFSAAATTATQAPSACATLLSAWRHAQRGALTAVVAGAADDPRTIALLAACRASPEPTLGIIPVASCRERDWSCLDGRRELSEPQVLLCIGHSCLAPARTVEEVAERLGASV